MRKANPLPSTQPCPINHGAGWYRHLGQLRQNDCAGNFWLQKGVIRNTQDTQSLALFILTNGAARPRQPDNKGNTHFLIDTERFPQPRRHHPTEILRAPAVQVEGNKNLLFTTTYWKTKERFLLNNLLKTEVSNSSKSRFQFHKCPGREIIHQAQINNQCYW